MSQHAEHRQALPPEREAIVHKFKVGDTEGYLIIGFFAATSGVRPGEIFLRVNKKGSTVQGFCNAFAIMVSLGLQYGVPISVITSRLRDENFAPQDNLEAIPKGAPSIVAYVARYLEALELKP